MSCCLTIVLFLAACSSMRGASTSSNTSSDGFSQSTTEQSNSKKVSAYPKGNPTHELVKQGVDYLREGNFQDAQIVFSAAIKLTPNSSTVHILNGVSYHLQFLNGSSDSKALAETAYGIAGSLDKSDNLPLIQLGRLHVDSGEYGKASKDFSGAVALSPNDQDGLYGLLQASLLQKNFKTALWVGDKLKANSNSSNVDQQRLLALMYVAAGNLKDANVQVENYAKTTLSDPKLVDRLRQQVSYINRQLTNAQSEGVDDLSKGQMIKMAADVRQGGPSIYAPPVPSTPISPPITPLARPSNRTPGSTAGAIAADKSSNDATSTTSTTPTTTTSTTSSTPSSSGSSAPPAGSAGGGGGAGGGSASGGGGSGTYTATSSNQQQQRWFDCDTKPGLGKAPGGSYGVPVGGTSGDQTLYLEPLPEPCNGSTPPRMAMIDAVLIRTVDLLSTSYGINLLTGLQIFAGAQRSTTTGTLPINASVIGLSTSATTSATLDGISGLLNYSLNIANSTNQSAQVVAKPTLTALDRIPSTFYSGQVQTVGLNGGGVSGAQVTNIPVGVSLSVTPTFIDDDTMMLAVKVTRSTIASAAPLGGFNAGIGTQQDSVTANVRIKYGETLVLDGLTDRAYSKVENGVPVLQDIPIIQYLFNNLQTSNYVQNVLVLITPRRLVPNEADLKRQESAMFNQEHKLSINELSLYKNMTGYQEMLNKMDSNLDTTISVLNRDSSYFKNFKNAVLADDQWVGQSQMSRFFENAATMLYFTR